MVIFLQFVNHRPNGNHKGQSTILLLGFLVVLSLMVIVLWTLNRVQGITPSPYVDQFRAKVIAQTGLERALAEFRNNPYLYFINDNNPPWFYWGEDLNHNNQLDSDEDQNNNNQLDVIECASDQALSPSFVSGSARKANGKTVGYSGIINRNHGVESDLYILKIIDTSSQIYLNGQGAGTAQLLNNLGKILGVGGQLGNRIIQGREHLPSRFFRVREELKEIVGETDYNKLEPYVTIWGVPNAKVIKPKLLEERPNRLVAGADIVRLSQLNPGILELESRVPININTASKTVLVSVMTGLKGSYLSQIEVTNPELEGGRETPAIQFSYETPPVLRIGIIKEVFIEYNLAEQLANSIIKERLVSPFFSWQDFNKFCDRLFNEGVFGPIDTPSGRESAQARADIIKANANPNSRLNDFNPNALLVQLIDKSDLSVYTTEFCFQPQGYFEIESTGIVTRSLAKTGEIGLTKGEFNITGLKKIRNIVKLFEIYQETTQQDFSRGVISKSLKRDFTHQNKTLQLYPEPEIEGYPEKCIWDGQIMRATKQNHSQNKEKNDLLTFQHHFDDSLKADNSAGGPLLVEETDTGGEISINRPNQQSLFEMNEGGPGSLYPDGVYSEAMSCPSYYVEKNLVDAILHEKLFGEKRFRGTITFWVKPNYFKNSTKPRILFSISKKDSFQPDQIYHYRVCQNIFGLFLFPTGRQSGLDELATNFSQKIEFLWFWELDKNKGNKLSEYVFSQETHQSLSNEWMHIGIAWDTNPPGKKGSYNCPNCKGTGKLIWREGTVICTRCNGLGKIIETKIMPSDVFIFCINGQDASKYIGMGQERYPPYISEHIDFSQNNLIRLGERFNAPFWNTSADATIDEFTIQMHETTSRAKEFIISEYREGRYYNGEGIFTSGLINLSPINVSSKEIAEPDKTISFKCHVDWSVYYPAGENPMVSPVEVQFFDERGSPISGILSYAKERRFEIPLGINPKRIKYKVLFREKRTDISSPLLETSVFDDIIITFVKPQAEIFESYLIP